MATLKRKDVLSPLLAFYPGLTFLWREGYEHKSYYNVWVPEIFFSGKRESR